MMNKIYEHLITKKKYNTLKLKYEVKCDDLQHKILELNNEKKVRIKQQDIFNKRISELVEENLKLKEQIIKLKKDLKGVQNEKK